MASIVLGTIGSAVGGSVGGTVGAAIGSTLGRAIGGSIDGALFGSGSLPSLEGPRLPDLAVQTSTYGKMIPMIYGTTRIAGNIIWSRPIRETATTTTSTTGGGGKGGGGGGSVTQTTTTYSYSVSLAIAICAGPIDSVLRVWADAQQLDLSQGTYRIYKGGEGQQPDAYIEGFEGVGKVPAYRGLAYVVVEDFPLADYGNRIPNFTFEVKKKAQRYDSEGDVLEEMVRSVTLIPGAGEFVYDTKVQHKLSGEDIWGEWAQQGTRVPINMHNPEGVANALLALDQMEEALPNLEWVGLVVTWFGTSLDAGECEVLPGVEYQLGATTNPDVWAVAGRNRATAHHITLVELSPRYGGTPSDDGVLRLVNAIKDKGWKVMFYPMFFMDVDGKPWRGQVTGSASDVGTFFTKTNGYNDFIMHYANLTRNKVDAFVVGSELVGLTKVSGGEGVYPAVNALVSLASAVKSTMGASTKITYAADWSEYHHTDGGWYNLDPLWASDAIDMVGIDAYFPLTDGPQQGYEEEAVMDGWTSGEGYSFYYADSERTDPQPLSAAYAWKNISWWWSNAHVNPDGATTAWEPESKPVWFTEYGFPSVDGATNEPNVFYDPDSVLGRFPRFSRGRVDFRAQRTGLMATERKWKNSSMIERMFIWTWDARPFPYWPDLLSVWADGGQWKTGHWINGKLGISSLAAIVADLCKQAGMEEGDFDVSRLTDLVEGYVVAAPATARRLIEQLMQGYFFDAVESDGVVKFVPRGGEVVAALEKDELVPQGAENGGAELLRITRQQEVELPQRVNVLYINRNTNYLQGNQFAQRQITQSRDVKTVSLPIVFSDQSAKVLAEQWLYHSWVSRVRYECHVPMRYATLEPTDIVDVAMDGAVHRMRVTDVMQARPGVVRLRGVAEDVTSYDVYLPPAATESRSQATVPVGPTQMEWLDLPALPYDDPAQGGVRLALVGIDAGWRGAVVYRSDDGGATYVQVAATDEAAIVGTALTALPVGAYAVPDARNTVDVLLLGDAELESVPLLSMLNGANMALLGEEIVQFSGAELLAQGKYRLSGLLRGRLGTEYAIAGHAAGERFILLNGRIKQVPATQNGIGLPRLYKPVSVGMSLGNTDPQSYAYSGASWRPYSPVHVTATRDDAGDIALQWVRRTRLNGGWRDAVDVPLGESAERYEVEIMDGEAVKRVLITDAPQVTYSAAAQVSDFGAVQDSVQLRVYQLSDVVGRGRAAQATV
jgi:hypothetical protein